MLKKYINNPVKFLTDFNYNINREKYKIYDFQKKILDQFEQNNSLMTKENFTIALFAPKALNNKRMRFLISFIIKQLPENIFPSIEKDNLHFMSFSNNSRILFKSKPIKGRKFDMIIYDEAAFIKNLDDNIRTMYQTLNPNAKIIISSTPNYKNDDFDNIHNSKVAFHHINIHWSLIKTKEWYKEQCKLYRYNTEVIACELDLIPKPNKQKDKVITFRLKENIINEIDKIVYQDNSEFKNSSEYIRYSIEKDIKKRDTA